MNKIVAIHQPNFFPWLGYFDKIVRVDKFIFLDHVQLPKKKGSWTNRVPIFVSGEKKWVTASIKRNFSGTKKVNEIQIELDDNWKRKFIKTLKYSYGKCVYFKEVMNFIEPLILFNEENLSKYNIHCIKNLMESLEIETSHLILSSDLNQKGTSNNLLINLIKSVGGNSYLCGAGAKGYQDDNLFDTNGIELIYQNFNHPVYEQLNREEFIPGLSIIDCLMNKGFQYTSTILKNVK
jgi:hypothetical protein